MNEILFTVPTLTACVCIGFMVGALLCVFLYNRIGRDNADTEDRIPRIRPPFHSMKEVALYKGRLLSEILDIINGCYGGVPTFEERAGVDKPTWQLSYSDTAGFYIVEAYGSIDPIAFYTREDGEKFISDYDNLQRIVKFYRT